MKKFLVALLQYYAAFMIITQYNSIYQNWITQQRIRVFFHVRESQACVF